MNDFSPPITSVGANDAVSSAFSLARNFGNQSFATAFSLINQLSTFQPEGVAFDTSFTVPSALLTGLDRPEVPGMPGEFQFGVTVPDAPTFDPISIPEAGEIPELDATKPILDFSGRPAPFAKLPPTVPQLIDITIPDSPEVSLPEIPTFEELNLPEPPALVNPEFTSELPVFDVEPPDIAEFDHTYTPYSEVILDEVRAEISRMLEQGSGLPPAIEQLLFERGMDREDQNVNQALDEVDNNFAGRGFTLPSGVQLKLSERVMQQVRANKSGVNRDLTINAYSVIVENLRFAVEQGIAAETLMSNNHFQAETLKLQIATYVRDLAISLYRARIEVYNAEVAAFRADAEVFAELIRAELAKVEVFRAQIDAERLRGEINQQRVELYQAQLQAVNTIIAIYNGEMEGARVKAQVNESIIRGFASEIDAYSAEVQAKESEFRAWGEQIRGEATKMDAYRTEVQAFVSRVQAYSAGEEAKAIAPRLQLEQQRVEADQFRAVIDGIQAQIAAEQARAQAIASIYGSRASIFASEGQIRAAEADANTRQFQALLEQSRLQSEASLKEAELNVQQVIALGNQMVEALRGAAQAASQLASASFSAVNASATISESGSASNSWGQAYNVNESR